MGVLGVALYGSNEDDSLTGYAEQDGTDIFGLSSGYYCSSSILGRVLLVRFKIYV